MSNDSRRDGVERTVTLTSFELEVLMHIVVRPREQVAVADVLPVLQKLLRYKLVSVNTIYPDMPDQNIWIATNKGIEFVRTWQSDGDNRHRAYGLSQILPR